MNERPDVYQCELRLETDRGNGCTVSCGVPTFYLRSDVQGIVSADHAKRVALGMYSGLPGVTAVHAVVFPVDWATGFAIGPAA